MRAGPVIRIASGMVALALLPILAQAGEPQTGGANQIRAEDTAGGRQAPTHVEGDQTLVFFLGGRPNASVLPSSRGSLGSLGSVNDLFGARSSSDQALGLATPNGGGTKLPAAQTVRGAADKPAPGLGVTPTSTPPQPAPQVFFQSQILSVPSGGADPAPARANLAPTAPVKTLTGAPTPASQNPQPTVLLQRLSNPSLPRPSK